MKNHYIEHPFSYRSFRLRWVLIIVVAQIIYAIPCIAQWTRTDNGIYGGSVMTYAVSGSNIYAGTVSLGVFRSSNDGATWAAVNTNNNMKNYGVKSIVTSGNNIFAGTYGSGVFLSTDNGASWADADAGLTSNYINALAVSGSTVFAATQNAGIFRSTDNGTSWTAVNNGLPSVTVNALLISGTTLFAGTGLDVFSSADNGATWTATAFPDGIDVISFAVNGNNIFAGTSSSGVYLSTNNGATWTAVNSGLTNLQVQSLAIAGAATVFAGTMNGGMFKSTDNGASWTAVNASSGLYDDNITAIVTKGSTILSGTPAGTFKSVDDGTTWVSANTGFTAASVRALTMKGATMLAGVNGGVFASADNGVSWTNISSAGLTNRDVYSLLVDGSTIYAGTRNGLFASTNDGATWTARNNGLTNKTVVSLFLSGTTLLAGTHSGLFRSTNTGNNWTLATGTSSQVVLGFSKIGTTFFATINGEVHISTDDGVSWTDGASPEEVRALTTMGTTLFAGARDGCYVSADNGATWTLANNGFPGNSERIDCFAVYGTTLIAGTLSRGVYFTNDNGANWTAFAIPNFPFISFYAAAQALIINNDTLFAGTAYHSLWSRPLSDLVLSIHSLSPNAALVNATVTIDGRGFSTTPSDNTVVFNGTPATVTASTPTSITTTVPAGATTGPVSVTVGAITAKGPYDFTVRRPPTVSSFYPTAGPVYEPVTITGTGFSTTPADNEVRFNNILATVTASTPTSITTIVPVGAATNLISVTVNFLATFSASSFTVTGPLAISSFSPSRGTAGTTVTITGDGFSTIPSNNAVTFNGEPATITASTSTSITTIAPAGVLSGPISVTTNGLSSTTSTTNFIAPSIISSFNPASAMVGATITIQGAGFSTTPAGNTVSFNGTAATVTASTSTSITTQVPDGATTGRISVTTNAFTTISAGDFTVVADTSAPIVTNSTVSTVAQATDIAVSVTLSDPESGITSAGLLYRSISSGANFTLLALNQGSGASYSQTIPASAAGELGVEYKFDVTNGAGMKNDVMLYTSRVSIPGNGLTIPYDSPGSVAANYRIVAVPLVLAASTVSDVFDELGAVNAQRWRMSHYERGSSHEMNTSSQLIPGKGYWLITKDQPPALHTGEGTTVSASSASPFEIEVTAGWNQVGNPYNFNIAWADVQAVNNGLPGLRKYDGDFVDAAVLNKMEGGFVNVPSARRIVIPVTKNTAVNGRSVERSRPAFANALHEKNWEVYLYLKQGDRRNRISGLGMHEHATEGYDRYDGLSMPRFFDTWLEINHSKKYGGVSYSKDIVPPSENHVWQFSVTTSDDNSPMTFSWDNSYFGNGGPELYLWDDALQLAVNMRTTDHYTFNKDLPHSFRVAYGSAGFVREETKVRSLVLHNPWPNPARNGNEVTIAFSVPDTEAEHVTCIDIFDMTGRKVFTSEKILPGGYHQAGWKPSEAETSGIYLIRVATARLSCQVRVMVQ